jgi:hypothetical protein
VQLAKSSPTSQLAVSSWNHGFTINAVWTCSLMMIISEVRHTYWNMSILRKLLKFFLKFDISFRWESDETSTRQHCQRSTS